MKKILLGKSVEGRNIDGYSFGDSSCFNKTLIIGCLHGVEPQSKEICERYIEDLTKQTFFKDSYALIIPCLNPDGLVAKTRSNANGVDLNRNFPSATWKNVPAGSDDKTKNSPYYPGTEPASEPETRVVVDQIKSHNYKKIIAIHTNHFVANPNPPMINFDGDQSMELAEKLGVVTELPVHQDIGYPTPGSLGFWIGKDLKKISITVELDDKKETDDLYKKHGRFFEVGIGFV